MNKPDRGFRRLVHYGAVLSTSALVVVGMHLGGATLLSPAFTSDRPQTNANSESFPDRIGSQEGVTVKDSNDPFMPLSTASAEVIEQTPDSCISSPLEPGAFRISSNYGMRINPITGGSGLHAGVDLAAPMATPIHAVANGVVSYAGSGKAGRSSELVIIDHDIDGVKFSSWYIHMYRDGVFVQADQEVRAGEVIAEVGSNGFSTGPHLHLEIHTPIDASGPTPSGHGFGQIIPTSVEPSDSDESPNDKKRSRKSERDDSKDSESDKDGSDEPKEEETPRPEPSPDPEEGSEGEGEEDESGDDSSDASDSSEEDEETESDSEPEPEEVDDFDIEEEDDGGENDHTLNETVESDSGRFDPSSLGNLHDPLPFLRDLGYGLAAPSSCFSR